MRIEIITKDDDGKAIDPPRLIVGDDSSTIHTPEPSPNGWLFKIRLEGSSDRSPHFTYDSEGNVNGSISNPLEGTDK